MGPILDLLNCIIYYCCTASFLDPEMPNKISVKLVLLFAEQIFHIPIKTSNEILGFLGLNFEILGFLLSTYEI
jgi:hypothetical protein